MKNQHSRGFGSRNSSGLGTLSHHNMWKGQSHHPVLKPKEKKQNNQQQQNSLLIAYLFKLTVQNFTVS